MRSGIKILFVALLAGLLSTVLDLDVPQLNVDTVEPSRQQASTGGSHAPAIDFGLIMATPAQPPVVLPTQGSRLAHSAKFRSTTLSTAQQRRSLNRYCFNGYAPLAASGRLMLVRMTAPLRSRSHIIFFVIKLCRLLC